jgi:hypothetical protein
MYATSFAASLVLCSYYQRGLSATIGEPEAFNHWLGSVQKAHNFKHTFINHPHRYSHLRKFFYVLDDSPQDKFAGLDAHLHTNRMRFLHPISMLAFGARSMPSDLALEPADTLTLYNALLRSSEAISTAKLAELDPVKFFNDHALLRQRDILRYEVALKEVVTDLIASSNPSEATSPLGQVIQHLQDPILKLIPQVKLNRVPSKDIFRSNLIHLLSDLNAAGDLVSHTSFLYIRS